MKLHTAASILLPVFALGAVQDPVSGSFKGNGKETKLSFATALKGEPLAGKATTVIVFTEKDHSKTKRPDISAGFGEYGGALVITIQDDGEVVGCEVAHPAMKRQGFSSIGKISIKGFKAGAALLEGTLTTNGEVVTFGEPWEVQLNFRVPRSK